MGGNVSNRSKRNVFGKKDQAADRNLQVINPPVQPFWEKLKDKIITILLNLLIPSLITYIGRKIIPPCILPFFQLSWYILFIIIVLCISLALLFVRFFFKRKTHSSNGQSGSTENSITTLLKDRRSWMITPVFFAIAGAVYSIFNPPFCFRKEMIRIEAGTYAVGTKPDEYDSLSKLFNVSVDEFRNDLPFKEIDLPHSFEISRFEVTIEDYQLFLKDTHRPALPKSSYRKGGENLPVNLVTHAEAATYCEWLRQKTDQKYRLPKEEEWEIAAAGQGRNTFPWGSNMPTVSQANFANDKTGSVEVGSYRSNVSSFGVQDMAGNVAEWCLSSCSSGEAVRGGSWADRNKLYLRCANRQCRQPGEKLETIGFRILRE